MFILAISDIQQSSDGGEAFPSRLQGDLTGPVDRVYRSKLMRFLDVLITKQSFYKVLAIIKGAVDRQVVHVLVQHRGHLGLLNWADPIFRMEDND